VKYTCILKLFCNIAPKSQYIEIMKKIGEEIRLRRKLLKIDQKTLAELAGVSINTLTKIERGESNPSVNVLTKILDTLGMDIKIIIKGN
jgi:transcriptional regulator with XRE-family HTH domain